jgi:hypothetical protein
MILLLICLRKLESEYANVYLIRVVESEDGGRNQSGYFDNVFILCVCRI